MKFAIVRLLRFLTFVAEMKFPTLLVLSVLFLFVVLSAGCRNGSAKPSNPFAQKTVPPPATFSSQESYLGQTPGSYVPQTPAATFPSSPTQPVMPSNIPLSDATGSTVSGEKATLFAATKESGWTPVDVASTSQTAFQVMEAKVHSVSSNDNGILKTATGVPEALVVGTSHVVTTITDESQPAATLTEPQLLYSGKYTE